MQYQVPQFIEIEDKIFGPLTLKQFIYLAGAGGVCLACYTLLQFYLTVLVSLPVVIFALALAFYKVNDRPFIVTVEHAFIYFFSTKLYLWKQRQKDALPSPERVVSTSSGTPIALPPLTEGRLKDISWSLNIKDRSDAGVVDPVPPDFKV